MKRNREWSAGRREHTNFVMSLKTEVAVRGVAWKKKKNKEEVENSHERMSLGYRKSLSTYSIQMKLVFSLCATSFTPPYRYFFLCSYNVSMDFVLLGIPALTKVLGTYLIFRAGRLHLRLNWSHLFSLKGRGLNYVGTLLMKSHNPFMVHVTK